MTEWLHAPSIGWMLSFDIVAMFCGVGRPLSLHINKSSSRDNPQGAATSFSHPRREKSLPRVPCGCALRPTDATFVFMKGALQEEHAELFRLLILPHHRLIWKNFSSLN